MRETESVIVNHRVYSSIKVFEQSSPSSMILVAEQMSYDGENSQYRHCEGFGWKASD